jgi:hypothetical protein
VYLTTKRYEGVIDLKQVGQRVSDGLVTMISDLPGFVSFYCSEAEDNVMVTTSVFDSLGTAEESDRRVQIWATENLGFLVPNPPKTTAGEVMAKSGGVA